MRRKGYAVALVPSLAVLALLSAAAAEATTPIGWLDWVNLSNNGYVSGWALDVAVPSTSLEVHVYFDRGTAQQRGYSGVITNVYRSDVNAIYGATGNHGYAWAIPNELRDGIQHKVEVFAIDPHNAGNPLLSGTPQYFTWQLPAPGPIAPSGAVSTPNPIYQWTASCCAYDYLLQVYDSVGSLRTQLTAVASSICNASTCAFDTGSSLVAGAYTWTVKARAVDRNGTWSPSTAFTVQPPPAPTTISPTGTVLTPRPTFSWGSVAGATQYALVAVTGTTVFLNNAYGAASVCSGSTCSVTSDKDFLVGPYTWYVVSRSPAGDSPASAVKSITVQVAAPTLVSPNSSVGVPTPTYSWTAAPNVTSYFLQALMSPYWEQKVGQWITASTACSGTSCAATPAVNLGPGSYRWSLLPKNASGEGATTAAMSFTVDAPPVPTTISPVGTVLTPRPTFTWGTVASATQYVLVVATAGGQPAVVLNTTYAATSVCSGSTCSVTSGQDFLVGPYTWYVVSRNAVGDSPSSGTKSITVQVASPTLVSPNNSVGVPTPTYSWTAGANVTSYYLQVLMAPYWEQVVGQWINASTACSGTGCAATPGVSLGPGSYKWSLLPKNASGEGATTAAMSFTADAPPVPTSISPVGTVLTPRPAFTWGAVAGASHYVLVVATGGSQPNVFLNATYAATSVCSGSTCAVTPDQDFPTGSYTWYVQSRNTVGDSDGSESKGIVVDVPLPTLVSPNAAEAVKIATPTYTWTPAAGVTAYYLQVLMSPYWEVRVGEWVSASNACSASLCSYTPAAPLGAGLYRWSLLPKNASGEGAGTAPMSFTAEAPPVPTSTSPVGIVLTPRPTFTWGAVAGATHYVLVVATTGSEPTVFLNLTYDATAICSGSTCAVTPDQDFPTGSYTWYVQSRNTVGDSDGSESKGIVVDVPLPTLVSPNAAVYTATPTFTWTPAPGVTGYFLEVLMAPYGEPVFRGWYNASAVCGDSTCAVIPDTPLPISAHSWALRPMNASGEGAMTARMTFTVEGPPAPVQISPRGRAFTSSPSLRWRPVPAATGPTHYYIEVENAARERISRVWVAASQACIATFCSTVLPDVLDAGTYSWYILGRNLAGNGNWSGAMAFTVQGAPQAAPASRPAPPTPAPTVLAPPVFCPIWAGATQCSYTKYVYASDNSGRLTSAFTPPTQATVELTQSAVGVREGAATFEAPGLASPIQGLAPCGCPDPGAFATYQTVDGTGIGGRDYVTTQGTLTFAKDGGPFSIPIGLLNNCVEDLDRTFKLLLTAGINAVVPSGKGELNVTIADNDATSVAFASESSRVSENGSWITLRPGLSAWREDVGCPARTRDVALEAVPETATTPGDFSLTSPVAVTEGASTDIPVTVVDDTAMEGDETYSIEVPSQPGVVAEAPSSHSVTIEDDDTVLAALSFRRVTPCRVLSSLFSAEESRTIAIRGLCDVSNVAKAVMLTVTSAQATAAGGLEVRIPEAGAATSPALQLVVNGTASSNGHHVLGPNGDLLVKNASTGTAQVVIDVVGYFE